MKLPDRVFYRPRQEELIAIDRWAIIRIERNLSYDNNQYFIERNPYRQAIRPHLHGNWEQFDRLFNLEPHRAEHAGGEPDSEDVVYSVARHLADIERDGRQLPNILVVPNLSTANWQDLASRWRVFGCTMGHEHPTAGRGYFIQTVYEFESYGMIVLDRGKGDVELWVAKDGDKVAVPNDCHVTLYNLADRDNPLIALEFSGFEYQTTQEFARNIGPVLLAYYNDFEVIFSLNWLHINNPTYKVGVKLSDPPTENEGRTIRISREARLDLGGLLYEQLTQNSDLIGQFARLGIRTKHATPEAILEPLPKGQGSRLYFSSPLVDATQRGTAVYRYFFPNEKAATPPPASPTSEAVLGSTTNNEPVEKRNYDLPLVIVVEGGGDWVAQTYRTLFKLKVDAGYKIAVFYADDSRWKLRPLWADESRRSNPINSGEIAQDGLQPWEVYLDKAEPEDFAKYLNLRPDVVFIVTPDFTHSTIARHWIGKTPFVLVEKPFDSQVKNVENLLLALALSQSHGGQKTEVLGLDHYQFYALPICDLKPDIYKHIDYVIANVNFYLTENRPIEKGRARTLQYGLTLDLLPHFVALLAYFGDVGTIDEISVIEAGQYHPLITTSREGADAESIFGEFRSETSSRVKFTFLDRSKNGFRVPCTAVVGKGFSQEVKYLELTGRNGNSIRIDLNRKPANADPDSKYPWDSIFFLQGDQPPLFEATDLQMIPDPYFPKRILRVLHAPKEPLRFCRELERLRYRLLLDDLLKGTLDSINNTLRLTQGGDIVWALDRIWWAIQDARPWIKYDLGTLDPFTSSNADF